MNNTITTWLSRQQSTACMLLILILAGIVYGPFLNSPMIFDDNGLFASDNLEHFSSLHWERRIIPYFSAGFSYKYLSDQLLSVRLFNLLLHAGNGIFIFFLVQRIVCISSSGNLSINTQPVNSSIPALLAALVFIAHPVMVYGVGYATQRSGQFALFFSLASWLIVLTSTRRPVWKENIYLCTLYAAAMLSKEHVILLSATCVILRAATRDGLLASFRAYAPYIIFSMAFSAHIILENDFLTTAINNNNEVMTDSINEDVRRLIPDMELSPISSSRILQAQLFFKYWSLWLLPNPTAMSIDIRTVYPERWLDISSIIGITAFTLYGLLFFALSLTASIRGRIAAALLLMPWILYGTELATARLQESFVLYRAYIWFPVTLLLIGLAWPLLNDARKKLSVIFVIMAIIFFTLFSWQRLNSMSSDVALWDDAVTLSEKRGVILPGMWRQYYNRGQALMAKKFYEEAYPDMIKATNMAPWIPEAHSMLAVLHYGSGRFADAETEFKTVMHLQRHNIALRTKVGLALAYRAQGKVDESNKIIAYACPAQKRNNCAILRQRHIDILDHFDKKRAATTDTNIFNQND